MHKQKICLEANRALIQMRLETEPQPLTAEKLMMLLRTFIRDSWTSTYPIETSPASHWSSL